MQCKCNVILNISPIYHTGGDEGNRTPVQEKPHIQASTV